MNKKRIPTISFTDLRAMTNSWEPHGVMKVKWNKLLVDAEVFGSPVLMHQFIQALNEAKETLFEQDEHVDWENLVFYTIDQITPEHWSCT